MRRIPEILSIALATAALLLGPASAQDPDMECIQEYDPDGVDPGFGNYGDLICDYGVVHPSEQPSLLLFRETVINFDNFGQTILAWFLNGYNATKVNFVNFGRQRGFVNSIDITYYSEVGTTYVQTQLYFKEQEQARMYVEVYGYELPEEGEVPRISGISPSRL